MPVPHYRMVASAVEPAIEKRRAGVIIPVDIGQDVLPACVPAVPFASGVCPGVP